MKYILILENDERIKKELSETLKSIDPQLQLRFFQSLGDFHEWLKIAMVKGPLALSEGTDNPYSKDDTLRLIIAKDEFLGTQNMNLIRRARDFFIRKNLCTKEEPTSLVLTAFDSPSFDLLLAEERIINNVIFKPFDKLILKQHLEFALSGRHPLDGGTISTIEVNDKVEMLKRTHYDSFSEIGFKTINNHAIRVGAMTKYYADLFVSDSKKSVHAFCASCEQKGPEEFHCEFQFYGIETPQISHIRRKVLEDPQHNSRELAHEPGQTLNVLIIGHDANQSMDLKSFFSDKFTNLQITAYDTYENLILDQSNMPYQLNLVVADYELFESEKAAKWDGLCKVFEDKAKKNGQTLSHKPQLVLFARKQVPSETIRELYPFCKALFFYPMDRIFITKQLASLIPTLHMNNPLPVSTSAHGGVLKIANMVEIKQISEAGLVMNYYRAISIGSFREFILLRANELESPEITGTLNFTEEHKDGKNVTYANHFVFFGMRDHFLKHIRLWLRDTYIRTKGSDNE